MDVVREVVEVVGRVVKVIIRVVRVLVVGVEEVCEVVRIGGRIGRVVWELVVEGRGLLGVVWCWIGRIVGSGLVLDWEDWKLDEGVVG